MSWPGLRITNLDIDEERIELIVYDADFAAEIGQMGSGLQMWLQMVWYISRCPIGSTIVLDEPDVYMHPDLQQKIFKIVQRKFRQVIIATHSVEIISLVEPKQIVTVDKTICILDRDYHFDEEIAELYRKAEENHLNLHVWEKKEIENYILTPQSIFRLIEQPQETYPIFLECLSIELRIYVMK